VFLGKLRGGSNHTARAARVAAEVAPVLKRPRTGKGGFFGFHPRILAAGPGFESVFLLNFARFTGWPTNVFERADSPLVIDVLGTDPFGPLLDDAVRGETVDGRKFVVERCRHLEDIKTCHILFISQSEAPRLGKIIAALKERPILTVSDIESSAYRGFCVRFITEDNKIRLRINLDSLKMAGLTMSSQVLRLAEIVSAK